MISADALAKAILSQRDDISNKKLQKLAYYTYAWYLTIYEKRIAEISFEAWEHGPVSRRLYYMYRQYGWSTIPQYHGFLLVPDDTMSFIKSVVNYYGEYDAERLEQMTHYESPWRKAREGCSQYEASDAIITDRDMQICYAGQNDVRRKIVANMETIFSR